MALVNSRGRTASCVKPNLPLIFGLMFNHHYFLNQPGSLFLEIRIPGKNDRRQACTVGNQPFAVRFFNICFISGALGCVYYTYYTGTLGQALWWGGGRGGGSLDLISGSSNNSDPYPHSLTFRILVSCRGLGPFLCHPDAPNSCFGPSGPRGPSRALGLVGGGG